jgi:hypothetical protein
VLTIAPDGDANVLPDVRSQAHRLIAAALRTAHRTTIPKFFISECFPQPVSNEIISTCGGRQGATKDKAPEGGSLSTFHRDQRAACGSGLLEFQVRRHYRRRRFDRCKGRRVVHQSRANGGDAAGRGQLKESDRVRALNTGSVHRRGRQKTRRQSSTGATGEGLE